MSELAVWQLATVAILFFWSGFVRSGLGFGGAALTLPLLLFIKNDPLVFLPVIALHLLIFSLHTISTSWGEVNWPYLRKLLLILLVPKLIGIAGLLSLPAEYMTAFVYVVTLLYAIGYIFNYNLKGGAFVDVPLLLIGGYMSGASLIGAPLIVAVVARHLAPAQMRTTLFVLWFILVCVKLAAFVYVDVDLQLTYTLYLLPFAAAGHVFGLKLNQMLVSSGREQFVRIIGIVLVIISLLGLGKLFLPTELFGI